MGLSSPICSKISFSFAKPNSKMWEAREKCGSFSEQGSYLPWRLLLIVNGFDQQKTIRFNLEWNNRFALLQQMVHSDDECLDLSLQCRRSDNTYGRLDRGVAKNCHGQNDYILVPPRDRWILSDFNLCKSCIHYKGRIKALMIENGLVSCLPNLLENSGNSLQIRSKTKIVAKFQALAMTSPHSRSCNQNASNKKGLCLLPGFALVFNSKGLWSEPTAGKANTSASRKVSRQSKLHSTLSNLSFTISSPSRLFI